MKFFLIFLTFLSLGAVGSGSASASRASVDFCRQEVASQIRQSRVPRLYRRGATNLGTRYARQIASGDLTYNQVSYEVYSLIYRATENPYWSDQLRDEIMPRIQAASQTRNCR